MNCDKCKKPITGKVMLISPLNGGKTYHAHQKDCADYLLNMLNTPNNPHVLAEDKPNTKPKEANTPKKPIDLEAAYYDLLKRVTTLEKQKK